MTNQQSLAICAIWLSVGFTGYFVTSQLNLALASLCAFGGTFIVLQED